jgi:hypothetical protein
MTQNQFQHSGLFGRMVSVRMIFRNKTYSLLNFIGLTFGITAAALLLLWVEDELMWNRQFASSDHIYAAWQIQKYENGDMCARAVNNPIAEALRTNYPGVKNVMRYYSQWAGFATDNSPNTFNEPVIYTDRSVAAMLDL